MSPGRFRVLALVSWLVVLPLRSASSAAALEEVVDFGAIPATLRMYVHTPADMPARAPLVVALHGCTQEASTYAAAGWLQYADDRKFYLLLPEQSPLEHATNSCWSWFRAEDNVRGSGQAASIMAMIGWLRAHHGIDERRIYIDGLSAGGWMVPQLLADYPDVFAGGSAHAGGPAFCASVERPFWDWFGAWTTMSGSAVAMQCMGGAEQSAAEWARRARAHAPGNWHGTWPRLSIWQGDADHVVSPSNQQALLAQWLALQGLAAQPTLDEHAGARGSAVHRRYDDSAGRPAVETWRIAGMTHGIAIDTAPSARCGEISAFVLDEGVCAVRRIGAFWGL